MDTAKSVTPTAEVGISIIRPTSYAMAALYCSLLFPPPACHSVMYRHSENSVGPKLGKRGFATVMVRRKPHEHTMLSEENKGGEA